MFLWQRFSAWLSWGVSHPYGQLAFLVFLTLPLGISALIISDQSYKAIDRAVAAFESILANWRQPTITDVQVISRDATCPTGDALSPSLRI